MAARSKGPYSARGRNTTPSGNLMGETGENRGDRIQFSGASSGPVLGKGIQYNDYRVIGAPPEAVDYLRRGINCLDAFDHKSAEECFRRFISERPRDASGHYYLAIALLAGRDPRDHYAHTVEAAMKHLEQAVSLDNSSHHARLARLLVRDALLSRYGKNRKRLTASEGNLVRRVSPGHIQELLRHIPARESVWWRALAARPTMKGRGRRRSQ